MTIAPSDQATVVVGGSADWGNQGLAPFVVSPPEVEKLPPACYSEACELISWTLAESAGQA